LKVLKRTLPGPKRLITLFCLALRSLGRKKYGIRRFYICNLDRRGKAIPYFPSAEAAATCQVSVYMFVRDLIVAHGLRNLLDIGCGTGVKLREIIYPVCQDITGIDTEHSIAMCRQQVSFGRWLADDIEDSKLNLERTFDAIISADVIEHLADPDHLLAYIKRFADERTWIVISTPERDLVSGKRHHGPPPNTAHVREWNTSEFHRYIQAGGFEILDHFLTAAEKNAADKTSQVVLCRLKKTPGRGAPG